MIETQEHKSLAQKLKGIIYPWRKLTIAVDGVTGAGKSGLARYLAFQLDMPCVETDMLRIMNDCQPSYRYSELKNVVLSRHELKRPIIIEGIFLLDTLKRIGVSPDFLIYVKNSEANSGHALKESLPKYFAEYKPEENADLVFSSNFIIIKTS